MHGSILFLIFLITLSASAQVPFSLGVMGGANLTQDFQNKIIEEPPSASIIAYSTPKRWIAGGTAEVRLPFHLSVEVDALYHELEFTQAGIEPNGVLNSVSPAPVVTWEFPILVKYRFSFPLVKPFIDAGPAFRSAGNLNGSSPSNHGVAVGLGVEAHLWKLRIAPQFRYLRWAHDQHVGYFQPSTVPDQVEFLTAITFP
ncbi:MAG: outer membrane beta-barrel protein [Bryobacteraceae bacterium]